MNNRRLMYLRLLAGSILFIIVSAWTTAGAQKIPTLVPVKCRPSIRIGQGDVIYAGIDNNVTVDPGGYTGEISIRIENGTATHLAGDFYKVNPKNVGLNHIHITVGNETFNFMVRVIRIPDPELMAGRLNPGKYSAGTFKMQGGLAAICLDHQLNASFEIISYTVGANGGTVGAYREAVNNGAKWSGDAAQLINKAGPGTSVFFHNIFVKGTDGVKRNLGTIAFQLM